MIEVVAELSCNHAGELDNAMELIRRACDAGCDAVKFQCFEPDEIARDVTIPVGPWEGKQLSQLYREAHTPWEWFPKLFARAQAHYIDAFSSVFSLKALDYLETLHCPRYKVSSFEIGHHKLLDAIAQTGKPVVISTGMATDDDIAAAVGHFPADYDLTLLHCVSGYPAPINELNLWRIKALQARFKVRVGFSDHAASFWSGATAVGAGAQMLEKHLMLRGVRTLDEAFSLDPTEMTSYVIHARQAFNSVQVFHNPGSEEPSRVIREARMAAHQ